MTHKRYSSATPPHDEHQPPNNNNNSNKNKPNKNNQNTDNTSKNKKKKDKKAKDHNTTNTTTISNNNNKQPATKVIVVTKKHRCNNKYCKILLAVIAVVVAVTFIKEGGDSPLTLKIMESEFMQDLTGPAVELPGAIMNKSGYSPHFPAVFIPGIVSTGLEVWQGHPCAQKYFRQRFWGTSLMIKKILLDRQCWLDHIMLSPDWYDPPGIKLRSAQGLVASDYLVGDYWVWARIIENLALIGYDESNMFMGSYDWRLPFRYTEKRDGYFSRLKANIEVLRGTNENKKIILIGHSMGSNIALYFLQWIEHYHKTSWIEDHIEAFVNIGGPLLGLPKTLSAVLSGEMRDTAELNPALQFIKENLLSREDMVNLFRSFGSVPTMFPKGGSKLWPDSMISVKMTSTMEGEDGKKVKSEKTVNYTLDQTYELLRKLEPDYMKQVDQFYDIQDKISPTVLQRITGDDERLWSNPLTTPLPKTALRVYCLYGIGKPTEVAYHYKYSDEPNVTYALDTSVHSENVKFGVTETEGDGTVPLMSLGYMCVKGWKHNKNNPSKSPIITREYQHGPPLTVLEGARAGLDGLRGGAKTADHVDIMGNHELLTDLTKLMANKNVEEVVDNILSNINELAAAVSE